MFCNPRSYYPPFPCSKDRGLSRPQRWHGPSQPPTPPPPHPTCLWSPQGSSWTKIVVGEWLLLAEQAQMFLGERQLLVEEAKMCRTAKKYLFLGGINVPAHKLWKNYGFQEYQTTESWLWGTTTTFLSYNSWSNYNWTKGKNTNLFFVILNNFFKVAISKLP